jgi:hypothetical protein
MSANLTLKIRLGPLVSLEVEGDNCDEIIEALKGHQKLNEEIDSLCGDLAERIYPSREDDDKQQKKEAK